MKRLYKVLITLTLCTGSAFGQVARWVVDPCYENIRIEKTSDVLIGDSAGNNILWNIEGHRLYRTPHYLWNFNENMTVVLERQENGKPKSVIMGILSDGGQYTSLETDGKLTATYDDPSFHCGQLLVQDKDKTYRFIDMNGRLSEARLSEAYPFHNGYAACSSYKKWEKKKKPYQALLNDKLQEVVMTYDGKPFDEEDLQLISSINDEGIGIVVAKGKVFYFSAASGSLTPLYAMEGGYNPKDQVKIIDVPLSQNEFREPVTRGKSNKTGVGVTILFDKQMVPVSIKGPQIDKTFKKRETTEKNRDELISVYIEGGLKEIWWGKDSDPELPVQVLPAQLTAVKYIYDNKAIVSTMDRKWGVLEVVKDANFKLSLNGGENIPFKHKTREASLRIDVPRPLLSRNVSIEIADPKCGCQIKEESVRHVETKKGSFVEYDCILNIPDTLPSELNVGSSNLLLYPVRVNYDGFFSPVFWVEAKAWHYVYFKPVFSEETTKDGTLSFEIDLEMPLEEQKYPMKIDVLGKDSLLVDMEQMTDDVQKISETHYRCKISNLQEGINRFDVRIIEEGCPPVLVPYEVSYTKPVGRKPVPKPIIIRKEEKIIMDY